VTAHFSFPFTTRSPTQQNLSATVCIVIVDFTQTFPRQDKDRDRRMGLYLDSTLVQDKHMAYLQGSRDLVKIHMGPGQDIVTHVTHA